MADHNSCIGLVLSSVPAYSETFFKTKINGLANRGVRVILFAGGKENPSLRCERVRPFPVFATWFSRFIALGLLPLTYLIAPRAMTRFWNLERRRGTGISETIKRLYLNAHILKAKVDWLHYGFATLAIGRENVARAIGAKMALSLRGYDVNVYPEKFPGCYKDLWGHVDKVHSISKYLVEKAYSLGLPKDKLVQIITPAVESIAESQTDQAFHDPVRLLTVARLSWIKGLEYGIQAVAHLKAAGHKVSYIIIGEGPEYEKLKFEIRDLGVEEEVELAGKRSHEEIIEQLRGSDIYLQPSINEGFCNSALEAQAAGLLCIVSNAGGLPENVLDGVTGWIVPKRNPTQLAEAVAKIFSLDHQQLSETKSRARQRVREKFNIADHCKAWIAFYGYNV